MRYVALLAMVVLLMSPLAVGCKKEEPAPTAEEGKTAVEKAADEAKEAAEAAKEAAEEEAGELAPEKPSE